MRYAPTSPATPALMCTTVPPAKSSAPFCHSQPAAAVTASRLLASVIASGPSQYHTMCAIGEYANVNHNTANTSMAENFMRSAKDPTTSAHVIPAKVSWKATNTSSGIATPFEKVAPSDSPVTPDRNSFEKPPKNALPAVKVME